MRDRTLRVVDVARFAVLRAVRATTFRVVVRAAFAFVAVEFVRDTTLRDATPRDAAAEFVAVVGRAVFDADVPRGLARPDRGDWVCAIMADASMVGAIGSAKTTRIDNNVEHTKNAPINNNTVPSAFLYKFITERFFMHTLHIFRERPKSTSLLGKSFHELYPRFVYYNIFTRACKQENPPRGGLFFI